MVAAQESTEKKERYSRKKVLESIPWSDEQKRIFEAAKDPSVKHLMVNASAGSGKTSAIQGIVASLPSGSKITILAFNVHVAEELKRRIPSSVATITTAHGMGKAMLIRYFEGRNFEVNDLKLKRICLDIVKDLGITKDKTFLRGLARKLEQLCHFAMVTLTDYMNSEALAEMIDFRCLLDDDEIPVDIVENSLVPLIPVVIEESKQKAEQSQDIGLDDLVFLPDALNIQPAIREYLITDESQDSSAAMVSLYRRLIGDTGKFIAVGDENQAVFSFAGSDPRAWQKLKDDFKPVFLPLTVCRRSPKSHIALAQKIVSRIQPADYAPEGTIEVLHPGKLFDELKPGTLVICRLTAPLIKVCLKAIAQKIKARVRGRDIGKQLGTLAKQVMEGGGEFPQDFMDNLRSYCEPRIANFKEQDNESEAQSLEDKQSALEACFNEFGFNLYYLDVFREKIDSLFCGDDDKPPVVLSTIHRAKGDEATRVIILGSNWLPWLGRAKRQWQEDQEYNLQYVAVTRCKFDLDDPESGKLMLVPLPEKKGQPIPDWCLTDTYGGMGFPSKPFHSDEPEYEPYQAESVFDDAMPVAIGSIPVSTLEQAPKDRPIPIAEFLGLKENLGLRQSYRLNTPKESCDPESEALYKWILSLESEQINTLPERLKLKPHIEITDTSLFISKLKLEAQLCLNYYQGSEINSSPRSRYGALEEDIRDLQSYFSSAFISNG